MPGPGLQKLATWFCVVAALFMGVVPNQNFVLCICEEGTLGIQLGSTTDRDWGSACCKQHGTHRDAAEATAVDVCDCCTDIQIATKSESTLFKADKNSDLGKLPIVQVPLAPIFGQPFEFPPRAIQAKAKPPPGLKLIQPVVLRI